MAQKRFGSKDTTGRKLDIIGEYLAMYQKALRNTQFETHYIDGFAGSGEVPLSDQEKLALFRDEAKVDEEAQSAIIGSAQRAMDIEPPFSNYTFIDMRRDCVSALEQRFSGHENLSRTSFLVGDANEHIQSICTRENWRSNRAVVLLDPFGNQVKWGTIEAIAATKAIDLWYLFPAGLGVYRQIGGDGAVDSTHVNSITSLFGTENWKTAFLRPSEQGDLFGQAPNNEKVVTPESAADFMIERLKSVFAGGVMDIKIPLGKHSYPSYYLLFAWGNPSKPATRLASKLSKAAVKATDRKHGRTI